MRGTPGIRAGAGAEETVSMEGEVMARRRTDARRNLGLQCSVQTDVLWTSMHCWVMEIASCDNAATCAIGACNSLWGSEGLFAVAAADVSVGIVGGGGLSSERDQQ